MNPLQITLTQIETESIKRFSKNYETIEQTAQRLISTLLDNIFLANEYRYSLKNKKLYLKKQEITLTSKERELLSYLLFNSLTDESNYVDIEQIRKDVWKNKDTTIFSIRNKIMSIRNKTCKELITNKNNFGYRINLMTKF